MQVEQADAHGALRFSSKRDRSNSPADSAGLGLTFRDSKKLPVHGWYPYVEGFAAGYIEDLVRRYSPDGYVYDPFGGSGTVNLIASQAGVQSFFSEANPFMRFVAETKINARQHIEGRIEKFKDYVNNLEDWAYGPKFDVAVVNEDLSSYRMAFGRSGDLFASGGRDFFVERDLRELMALRDRACSDLPACEQMRDLVLLAIASVTVACSNMTRRADLRRRRSNEYIGRVVDVRHAVFNKLRNFINDINVTPSYNVSAIFSSSDCREFQDHLRGKVSLVLTSPPYLNGTNYIRNTKLELWLMGFIKSERELVDLNKVCMVCGINNVVKGRPPEFRFSAVEKIASKLDDVSPDARIPAMVRGYFSDMRKMFFNCASYLTAEGRLVLDIGDSRFYGVNVPTDRLLVEVAKEVGLALVDEKVLARRHSRDRTPLQQVELTFAYNG